jgi:HD-GYP domain-containing protein (c-di-GMP phosphodiesterase class II)
MRKEMRFVELETVKRLLEVGKPLLFNVREPDHTLLLAKGQILESAQQIEALLRRGTLVDVAEFQAAQSEEIRNAPREQLPRMWTSCIDRVSDVLAHPLEPGFELVSEEISRPLVDLVERDPDLAIFQIMRQNGSIYAQYGVNHSIHCAVAALLATKRLGWELVEIQRAVKAALTMNVSMLELQGQLATQAAPITPQQRDAIHAHPRRSVEQLRLAGIEDAVWLEAVEQHHEQSDGSGYPAGLSNVAPLAAVLRQCDIYTTRLTPRRNREAMAADAAARGLFSAFPRNPMTAALIKEFGIYPPGSFVKLVSGEIGMVVRRGSSAHTPMVSVFTDARGSSLPLPQPRDTSNAAHNILTALKVVSEDLRPAREKLLEAVLAS